MRLSKTHFILASSVALLLLVSLSWFLRPREPEHAGRPLKTWLLDLDSALEPNRRAAEHAVREIGADGIPTLLRLLQYRDSYWHNKFESFSRRHSFLQQQVVSPLHWRHYAGRGFECLRSEGALAVPLLIRLLEDPDPAIRRDVCRALAGIGPAAISSIPHLVRRLEDPQDLVRQNAIWALSQIGPERDDVLHTFIQVLEGPSRSGKVAAVQALARQGSHALPAIPALERLLQDTDGRIASTAANALNIIRPAP